MREVYRAMLTARELDRVEQELVRQGQAFFHVSGAGHEATAALAAHLTSADWLHLHYRDKALLLARGVAPHEFIASFLCRAGSHSSGRQMSAHLSAPERHILSLVGPVGNNALQAVGVAAAVKDQSTRPLVVCSVGDGTTQEGEFLEAVAEAVRSQLPVLFLIEDNHLAISTSTRQRTFWDLPSGPTDEFYGLPIHRIDGTNVRAVDAAFAKLVGQIRRERGPVLAVLQVERLADHTNADDQSQYRDAGDVARHLIAADPIQLLEADLVESGIAVPSELNAIHQAVVQAVRDAATQALQDHDPVPEFTAKAPLTNSFLARRESTGQSSTVRLTLREALTATLGTRLATDPRVFLYGQDIEDPKGDVFGVTRGLSTRFPGRVVNSPLSESTIVGTCIGRALAGQRPVAFIQFADFLPLAYNQILSELGSMYWRTNGGWQCPVILMVTCGGYKPGLGPFHAQTLESVMAHTPGIDVVMPSSAGDAAGLLNAAFESDRPTIFFYPKSCLNLSARATSDDVARHFVPLGKARRLQGSPVAPRQERRLSTDVDRAIDLPATSGVNRTPGIPVAERQDYVGRRDDVLTLVTWGNTVTQCEQVARTLAEYDLAIDLLDLRSLSPWDEAAVLDSVERTGRLVVVHEDNHTCGFGAEVAATVAEKCRRPAQIRRVTRPDTYVPCHFASQLAVLPSFQRTLEACADLLGFEVRWEQTTDEITGLTAIRAIGSGPADESVEIVAYRVCVGDEIVVGQVIAEVEATKSVIEVAATSNGTVKELCAQPGGIVAVGQPLLRVQATLPDDLRRPITREDPGLPRLTRRASLAALAASSLSKSLPAGFFSSASQSAPQPELGSLMNLEQDVYLSRPACVLASRVVSTEFIANNIPGWTTKEAIKRTGVASRCWVGDGETVVTLATRAAHQLLDALGTDSPTISAVLCSTTSPQEATPSIACQVATSLAQRGCFSDDFYAFDFNAACSGFLYGIRLAADHLRGNGSHAVLVLTSEVLSPVLNLTDPVTAFLFGDAASATLVTRQPSAGRSLRLHRPLLSASPDPDRVICSPCVGSPGHLTMDGIAVARTAYKTMAATLTRAAAAANTSPKELSALIPHPGSQRVLQNVAEWLEIDQARVFHTLADTGNTSSSSIPLALDRFWPQFVDGQSAGLVAFGAGFTSAATLGEFTGET